MINNVPKGIYAVSVHHDENKNGKLDTNVIGIPIEGIGASRNPSMTFGPPEFDEANFRLKNNIKLKIKLKYY